MCGMSIGEVITDVEAVSWESEGVVVEGHELVTRCHL